MLDLTAAAEVDGVKFDGVDLFLFAPHVDIDASDDELKRLADKVRARNLVVGTVVAPVWPPTGGGSAMGDDDDARSSSTRCARPAASRNGCASWACGLTASCGSIRPASPDRTGPTIRTATQQQIAETFREACDVAEDFGERLAAEGEICWGGMHSWRRMVQTAGSGRTGPKRSASRPTWPTRCSTCWATTPRKTRSCPQASTGTTTAKLDRRAEAQLTDGPAPLDDRLPRRPERRHRLRLRLARQDRPALPAGRSQRQARTSPATPATGCATKQGKLTKKFRHICWDGCMFPNAVMMKPETWNDILTAMVAVRDGDGWQE